VIVSGHRGALADTGLADYVSALRAHPGPPITELGPGGLRAASRARAAARPSGPDVASAEDFVICADLPVRLYRPKLQPLPLVVYLHGGGWTTGDLDSHDRICRRLATTAGCAVLAVDYRRAPEHVWPAAVEDAVAAVRWSYARSSAGWTDAIAVAGDSSGGNLAALATLRLRADGDVLPRLQALAYPNTDLTLRQPSTVENATGWGLDLEDARWFASQWVSDAAMLADPRVSPLLEPDLGGLPPALVVTAEHDILRDEGDAYAARLAAAGVQVTHRCETGLIHGFLGLDLVSPTAAAAGERVFADIGSMLHELSG
jgi:acetyl esterase